VTERRSSREIADGRSTPSEVRRYRVVPRNDPRLQQRRTVYYHSYGQPAPPPSAPVLVPDIPTREVEEIRRLLTVQCIFNMIDAVTGQTILQYAPPPIHREDESSPDFFFGGLVSDTQLDPVDLFIGELVEQATTEFVGMLVPVNVVHTYELVGHGDEGEKAIRMLRAEEYETAYMLLQESYTDDSDEEDTIFALGVVCELLGQPDNALKHYRQLLSMEDVDDDNVEIYTQAKNRLAAHTGRIIPPGNRLNREPPEEPPIPPQDSSE
jgi:tetratricopeptide (TPR) repeat protein